MGDDAPTKLADFLAGHSTKMPRRWRGKAEQQRAQSKTWQTTPPGRQSSSEIWNPVACYMPSPLFHFQ